MTDAQRALLRQAADSIAAAKLLLAGGYPGFAAARAYYAMFYAAEAFLEAKELSFSKHSAVIAAFGKHVVRAGQAPVELHRYLLEAYDVRQAGDYGSPEEVTPGDAAIQIGRAEQFLAAAKQSVGPP